MEPESSMASADLRKELDCYVCLNTYSDPVTLTCGHSFCRGCITRALDTQEDYGDYSCPQCRERFPSRPVLKRNIALNNVLENLQTDQKESQVCCTYCIHSPVPAVQSCLLCEASLCEDHLKVHSKSPDHVLCDPGTDQKYRKCSAHKKILEYYCTEDSAFICVSCSLAGEHRGHRVEVLDEAFQNRMKRLTELLEKLLTKNEQTEEKIQQLLLQKGELTRKMQRIEELFNVTDIMTLLQESDMDGLCDVADDGDNTSSPHDGAYLSLMADVTLDVNTAFRNVLISPDGKTAHDLGVDQNRPDTPHRFQWCSQVMGGQGFSSGRHYWEVDVTGAERWNVSMCYPSVERGGERELFGRSIKSWCLNKEDGEFSVIHGWNETPIPDSVTSNRMRVYLNYEAGQISFYDMCHPIRHLYTFFATFTEPLHAAIFVYKCLVKII